MKLAVLKLLSLLVFLGGVLILGLILEEGRETGFFTQRYESFLDAVATGTEVTSVEGRGSLRPFGMCSGLAMLLVGLYGFVPRLRGRKTSFTYQSSAGEVTLQLDTAERSLQRVLSKMSEIRKARVQLSPVVGGKAVQVRVWALLVKPEGLSARATTERVHRFIEITAKEHLALEDLAPIALCVDFEVDAKASERTLRTRLQREADLATVSAPASVAAAVGDEMVVAEIEEVAEADAEDLEAVQAQAVDWASRGGDQDTQSTEEEPPGALDEETTESPEVYACAPLEEVEEEPEATPLPAVAVEEESFSPYVTESEEEEEPFKETVGEGLAERSVDLEDVGSVIPLPAPEDYPDDFANGEEGDADLPNALEGPEPYAFGDEEAPDAEDKDQGSLPPLNY